PRPATDARASAATSNAQLERAQERLQIAPFPVGEVDVEAVLVEVDHLADVFGAPVVEVRRARGEAAQRRHAELGQVRPDTVAAPAHVADLPDLARGLVLQRE